MVHEPDPRHSAFGAVFVVAQHLDRMGDAVLAPLGLTTKQWLLLAVVERGFPGRRPTLTQAAALYGSSRQNVKAVALGLQAAGYLRLERDPGDRRSLLLVATDRTAVFATPAWQAREAAFFALAFGGLEPGEVTTLADLLERWLAVVAPQSADPGAAAAPVAATPIPAPAAPAAAGRTTPERTRP